MQKPSIPFAALALALVLETATGLQYVSTPQESGQPASGHHQGPGGQSEGGRPTQNDQQLQELRQADQSGTQNSRQQRRSRKNHGKKHKPHQASHAQGHQQQNYR